MVDQQKTNSLPFYGNSLVKTPNLVDLASDGTIFKNAFTSCPLCVPSRVSLFTSQYPSVHGSVNNDFLYSSRNSNFISILKQHGFKTGLAGKNHCFNDNPEELFEFYEVCDHFGPLSNSLSNQQKSSRNFLEKSNVLRGAWGSIKNPYDSKALVTSWVTDKAIEFVSENQLNDFFLWYSIPDPHVPFHACEPFYDMYPIENIELPPFNSNEFSNKPNAQFLDYKVMRGDLIQDDEIRKVMSVYYGMNTFIDSEIGRFLHTLKHLDIYDKSVIVYISDHGEYLGEHKMIRKSKSAYDCLINIPLLIKLPKQHQIKNNNLLVAIEDIYPTLCDELGIKYDADVQGKSFYEGLFSGNLCINDFLYGEYGAHNKSYEGYDLVTCQTPFSPDFHPYLKKGGYGKMRFIRTDRWKFVNYLDDCNELYDLENDPYELENLYEYPEYHSLICLLKDQLIEKLISITQPSRSSSSVS